MWRREMQSYRPDHADLDGCQMAQGEMVPAFDPCSDSHPAKAIDIMPAAWTAIVNAISNRHQVQFSNGSPPFERLFLNLFRPGGDRLESTRGRGRCGSVLNQEPGP